MRHPSPISQQNSAQCDELDLIEKDIYSFYDGRAENESLYFGIRQISPFLGQKLASQMENYQRIQCGYIMIV